MCGIAGSVGTDLVELGRIRDTLSTMKKRGPDFNDYKQARLGNSEISLLHTRLAIIDLNSHSNQPFVRDGISLVFNGEI